MKIALIGYGKMGQMIASIAKNRGHEVVCIVDPIASKQTIDSDEFRSAAVAIEFSHPDAAEANIRASIAQGVPVLSGTTGWLAADLQTELQGKDHPGIIWSSNYSIGVNVLFAVNKYLAKLLHRAGGYRPSITEVHHVHKFDAPSGTAKTLREAIVWQTANPYCPIEAIREGEIPGIHEVRWESPVDILSLRHEAKSRQGFAWGAILAAEWLADKRGWHTLNEVLGLSAI